jgi:hypothetical protein
MKTNMSITALIGAAALVIGGVAVAQSTTGAPPPTSTAGNGCTATGNAMKGGNLGGHASAIACDEKGMPVAATRTTTTETASTTSVAPAAAAAPAAAPTAMASPSEPVRKAPMRVARADRN